MCQEACSCVWCQQVVQHAVNISDVRTFHLLEVVLFLCSWLSLPWPIVLEEGSHSRLALILHRPVVCFHRHALRLCPIHVYALSRGEHCSRNHQQQQHGCTRPLPVQPACPIFVWVSGATDNRHHRAEFVFVAVFASLMSLLRCATSLSSQSSWNRCFTGLRGSKRGQALPPSTAADESRHASLAYQCHGQEGHA